MVAHLVGRDPPAEHERLALAERDIEAVVAEGGDAREACIGDIALDGRELEGQGRCGEA